MLEIKETMDGLAKDWDVFKQTHSKALEKGEVELGVVKEKLAKIEGSMSKAEDLIESMQKIEAAAKRSGVAKEETQENAEEREAFRAYFRSGKESAMEKMSSYSDPAGGYTIIPELDREITRVINETSLVRQFATVKSIGTDQYEKMQRVGRATARWRDREAGAQETSRPNFEKISIKVHELEAMPSLPSNLVNDSVIDIEAEVRDAVAEEFSLAEGLAFIQGNGSGQPRGLLSYDAGTSWGQIEQVNSGDASLLTADGLQAMVTALKDGYRQGARWYMNRLTRGAARTLKDGQGNYLWQPNFQQGEPMSILGYPVTSFEDMPDVAVNALPIIFGDLKKAYKIIDRTGTRVLVDPYSDKPNILYYTTKRVGGGVDNFEAIKIQVIAA